MRDTLDITPELLLRAYAAGIFPMAETRDTETLYWFDPDERGVLPLDRFHVPRSLRKVVRRRVFEVRCNSAFAEVVTACAEPTAERPDSWINGRIQRLVNQLHAMGAAHSMESWRDGELVGGLYGITLGGAFFGESMFSRRSDASKVALVHLVARLRMGGYRLLDAQFMTPHLRRLGAVSISKAEYRRRLNAALKVPARFVAARRPAGLDAALEEVFRLS